MTAPGADIQLSSLTWCASPVGPLVLGATDDAICMLEFADDDNLEARLAALRMRYAHTLKEGESALLEQLRMELAEYFAGARKRFDAPLAYAGSPFQRQVWTALCEIPYGDRRSYLEVAQRVGDPLATRAVGAANGLNPIAIVIPCHRVVNADGKLGGYGGGLWRKRILLDLELGQGTLSLA